MSKEQKLALCEFLRAVKFLDGYAANLAKCVTSDGFKLSVLKTHDCHILLQRILPAGLRGIMDKDIHEAVLRWEISLENCAAKHSSLLSWKDLKKKSQLFFASSRRSSLQLSSP